MNNKEIHQNPDSKERLELLFKKISRLDFYINSTNAKASIIVAWNGIVIGTIFLKYSSIIALYVESYWAHDTANVLLAILAVSSLVSIAFVLDVINPFLSSGSDNTAPKSLIFFGDIAETPYNEYVRKECESSDEEVIRDALNQCHILSIGLNNKMKSMQGSIASIKFCLLTLLLLVILKGIITHV